MAAFLVNGLPAASVDAGDRGLLYGDGVFRTLAVRAGRPLNWKIHYRLLARDCAALGLACPEADLLVRELAQVAPGEAAAKVIVTRGIAGRGYAIQEGGPPTRIVAAYPPPARDDAARAGVRVRRCALVLAEQPRLAGVKSLNRLENVLARAEWRDADIREGLLCDGQGRLIEGTMSNVFLVMGGSLVTPSLERCGVAGAQRERILALAAGAGVPTQVRDVAFAELGRAEEVFLSNSLIGIWPVIALDDQVWSPGSVARFLQAGIEAEDAKDT